MLYELRKLLGQLTKFVDVCEIVPSFQTAFYDPGLGIGSFYFFVHPHKIGCIVAYVLNKTPIEREEEGQFEKPINNWGIAS